ERDNHEIEMVLFLPIESRERDFETQAIFERDSFYSVGGKVVPGHYEGNVRPKMTIAVSTSVAILNKVSNSNKCPLKISLTGIPQELPRIVGTDGDAVVN
ncbi:1884_t:CDS:2, partial [Dentiscutata erythropus]